MTIGRKMRIATLFSGIGAPEQGAMRVYDVYHTFACEWDKFARQSFLANYDIDEAHFHKDIYDMDGTQYQGKCDILIGGSPCQAFSIAGLRKGLNDKRGELIYEYIRIVDEVKAPIIVYENVKGMLSIDKGRTIKEFVQALRDIGYHCHYSVINSKDYGVPQNRERLFLVGFLDVALYHAFSFAPKVKLTKRLHDVLESEVDEKYYINRPLLNYDSQCNTVHDTEKESPTICAGTHGYALGYIQDTNRINRALRVGGSNSITDKHCFDLVAIKENEPKILQLGRGFNNGGEHEICPTLTINSFERNNFVKEPMIRQKSQSGIRYREDCGTLAASANRNDMCVVEPKIVAMRGRNPDNPKSRQSGLPTVQMLEHNENGTSNALTCVQKDNMLDTGYGIRKLTPRECLRLQDFPDTFKQVVSDSQLYKQAGNSMTVAVLEMIFRQIEKAKQGDRESLFGGVA